MNWSTFTSAFAFAAVQGSVVFAVARLGRGALENPNSAAAGFVAAMAVACIVMAVIAAFD
jgi:hypothetical protein